MFVLTEGKTLKHNGITYTEIESDSCVAFGTSLHEAGKKWHIHVLPPACPYNPYAKFYAMVIEDDSEGRAYISPSEAFPEADRVLVQLLHGEDVLQSASHDEHCEHALVSSPLLDRVRRLSNEGTHWHHHMHFPECVINPHPGQWTLSIDTENEQFTEIYADEPFDVLRELEVIHFAELDGKGHEHRH